MDIKNKHLIAKITGTSILVMALLAGFSEGFVFQNILVDHNALATAQNIMESEALFQYGIFGFLVILFCDVVASWGFYHYLKEINPNISLVSALFRLIYSAILGIALYNLILILFLLKDTNLSLTPQLNNQILLFFEAFYDIWSFGLIIFGIHIFFLGILVFKTKFIPKIIGILLIIAAFGYFFINIGNLLFPEYENLISTIELFFMAPMVLGEVGFGIWMLIKKNVDFS